MDISLNIQHISRFFNIYFAFSRPHSSFGCRIARPVMNDYGRKR